MSEEKGVVAVTGANRGIGLAIAQKIAAEGYGVAALVRTSSSELDALVQTSDTHKSFDIDLADDDTIKAAARELFGWTNTLAGLVNCAGMASGGLFAMTRMDDMRALFNVNYFGQLMLTQYVAKKMVRAKSGSIVNIASTAGLLADRGTLAYGSSKAALIHATRVLASELGDFGIRVNAIAPSVVATEMMDQMDEKAIETLDAYAALTGHVEVEDVAELTSFLLSSRSRKMTGQVLRLDRGMPF